MFPWGLSSGEYGGMNRMKRLVAIAVRVMIPRRLVTSIAVAKKRRLMLWTCVNDVLLR